MKFIVDANSGKLAKWLRLMGNDARFFEGKEDSEMILIALREERLILTRDTHVMAWSAIASGRVKAILIEDDEPEKQVRQVVRQLGLGPRSRPFSVCLECNEPLIDVDKAAVQERVPPHVFETHDRFSQCPACHRVYWRGTHWHDMQRRLESLDSV